MSDFATFPLSHQIAFLSPIIHAAYRMHYVPSEAAAHLAVFKRLVEGYSPKELNDAFLRNKSALYTKTGELAKVPELHRCLIEALFRHRFGHPVPSIVRLTKMPEENEAFEICMKLLGFDEHFDPYYSDPYSRIDFVEFFTSLDGEKPFQLFASLFQQ